MYNVTSFAQSSQFRLPCPGIDGAVHVAGLQSWGSPVKITADLKIISFSSHIKFPLSAVYYQILVTTIVLLILMN